MATLDNALKTVVEGLRSGRFINEAAVSQGAVLPLLQALNWPIFDTSVVIPQFSLEGRRVDYALCHPGRKPLLFLEIKRLGATEGADRQLFEYAFHKGVPMAILTDGQEWHFYLPAEQGEYDERRVYKLDLLERELSDCTQRLIKYLQYEAVCTGRAIEAARADYKDIARGRHIAQTLPEAWKRIISEPDELLLELLADKVEDLCGYKPSLDDCSSYLGNPMAVPFAAVIANEEKPVPVIRAPRRNNSERQQSGLVRMGFMYKNQEYPCGSAREAATKIFRLFAQNDSTFYERFSARKHGRLRRYIARNKNELYSNRPDLIQNHSFELDAGWYMGTNYSTLDFEKIISMACEVAGVTYGSGLILHLR